MADGALLPLVFVFTVLASFVLYTLVVDETDDLPRMTRQDGERVARADTVADGRERRNDRD